MGCKFDFIFRTFVVNIEYTTMKKILLLALLTIVFAGCKKDEPVVYVSSIVAVAGIDYETFEDGTASVSYSYIRYGKITIPSSIKSGNASYQVTSIRGGVFSNLEDLYEVFIPSSITKIGNYAFSGCKNLKKMHFNRPVPPVCGINAFLNISPDCILYVPNGSSIAYYVTFHGSIHIKEIVEMD